MINGFEINGAEINGESNAALQIYIACDSPLGTVSARLFSDWSGAIPEGTIYRWVLDIEGAPTVRIPIKSWQATLRADFSSYVQAVIPGAGAVISDITSRLGNDMVITRVAVAPDGTTFEQEMARAPASSPRIQRGPTNHTVTLSGYAISFFTPDGVDAVTARTLNEIRTITGGDEARVRCGIDWFLRPGQQAIADGESINVSYINYIVNGVSEYMDVGGVAA